MKASENEIKRFILTLVSIRTRLINHNVSEKNLLVMSENISFLKTNLIANRYTDEQMKSFFIRHSARIYSIIPGGESKCGKKLMEKFNYYYSISK